MAKPKDDGTKLILSNRRASYNFELGDKYEAGLVLIGSEVKTLRQGSGDLTDGWVDVKNGEAFLKGVFLPRLQHAAFGHEERRDRKLLLHEREIEVLRKAKEQNGLTLVPTRVYWKDGRAKVEIAISKGKKDYDKRHSIKEKELDREARSAISRGRRGE
jgi:SsrA-binding protein